MFNTPTIVTLLIYVELQKQESITATVLQRFTKSSLLFLQSGNFPKVGGIQNTRSPEQTQLSEATTEEALYLRGHLSKCFYIPQSFRLFDRQCLVVRDK